MVHYLHLLLVVDMYFFSPDPFCLANSARITVIIAKPAPSLQLRVQPVLTSCLQWQLHPTYEVRVVIPA